MAAIREVSRTWRPVSLLLRSSSNGVRSYSSGGAEPPNGFLFNEKVKKEIKKNIHSILFYVAIAAGGKEEEGELGEALDVWYGPQPIASARDMHMETKDQVNRQMIGGIIINSLHLPV